MLRTAIRRAVRAARNWVAEEHSDGQQPVSLPGSPVDYDWLNRTLFPGLLAKGGRAFRPNYTWGVLQGVHSARELGLERVSVIEFGVAGGNGLLSLAQIAQKLASLYEVEIDVYGFDTGAGLPKPADYRDLPHIYAEGGFSMDVEKLRARLQSARLVLGPVESTITDFVASRPSPVAFVSFDLDLYSSTAHALQLLDAEQDLLLPRIYCYFNDIMGLSSCEYNGERLAIAEFNAAHEMCKLAPIYGLKYFLPSRYASKAWTEQFFIAHIFDHTLYSHFDGLAPAPDLGLAGDGSTT
jgi:hypothetical protein